jgi:2-dehydropantoate 2-reductase
MKILVYGAGNIGSLYAAVLKESGQDVCILARGKRVADIRDFGIRLESTVSAKRTTTLVNAVERLNADDHYDLVLVILPKNRISQALPILAASRQTPSIMFFCNNAAGAQEMTEALGVDRVLLGFPGAAAVSRDDRIRYLILPAREQPTTIGELDGHTSSRLKAIEEAFQAAGFAVAICSNSPDALVLMRQAILEGYRVLSANGIPITPKSHRIFQWLPKPLLLLVMRRMIESDTASIKIGHALGARDEMKTIADELRSLARKTSVPTPAMERLCRYLDLAVGSAAAK